MNNDPSVSAWDAIEPGQRLGPYRVVREIGRGGMARVYLAERADDQFDQQVALKLLRPGHATREGLRRFQLERQIVASLNHPNIARLYDGGLTEDGRPYFAMEYVEGRPIDVYCDANRLTIDERLNLFRVVGQAVQYAHRNLLIHRDIKPPNILVTRAGEAAPGRVKLLDFGIAKPLDPEAEAPQTRTNSFWMTPEYASPEQIRGDGVNTASDQYQLGLLLYRLLVGRGPYLLGPRRSFVEVAEAVTRQEPQRPSTLVARTRPLANEPEVSKRRATTPRRLRRQLRGDLDTIVLKALRKEPELRYASVEQMIEDLDRYQAGMPVKARAGSAAYRIQKFVRRHRLSAAAAAAFLFLLVGYAVTVTVQSRQIGAERDRAQTAARRAEQVKDFLVELFEVSDAFERPGEVVTARHLLDRGAARIEDELAGEPEIRAEMMHVIGKTYTRLGEFDEARPLLEGALELAAETSGADDLGVAQIMNDLAMMYRFQGDYPAAEQMNRQALDVRRRLIGTDHGKVAGSLHNLASILEDQGRYVEAEVLYREALAMDRRLGGGDWNRDVSYDLNSLGGLLVRQGRWGEAEQCFRRALEIRLRVFGESHPTVAVSLQQLALVALHKAELGEAEDLAHQALDVHRRTYAVDTHYAAQDLETLGRVLLARGDLDGADQTFREALAIYERLVGGQHRLAALVTSHLARVFAARGDHERAATLHHEAFEILLRHVPEQHPDVADVLLALGRTLAELGRVHEAEPPLRQALAIRSALYGSADQRVAEVETVLEGL